MELTGENLIFLELPDGRGNQIRLSAQKYRNKNQVHLRRYWQPGGDGSEWIPTKIGFVFNEEQLRELEAAVTAARERLGW